MTNLQVETIDLQELAASTYRRLQRTDPISAEMVEFMLMIKQWWRKQCRINDLRYLWPAIKNQAANIEQARAAFYQHCLIDDAWEDFGVNEIRNILDCLQED